jgi:hypothetical protein
LIRGADLFAAIFAHQGPPAAGEFAFRLIRPKKQDGRRALLATGRR